mmetsp:Transcript_16991/g.68524  ORF Transcript_16991/g.68524 Transcript_16991/m.68524 type:complete len:214 (+) Transcript_16991:275-916(+)
MCVVQTPQSSSAWPPTSASFLIISSASSFLTSFLSTDGTLSTASLASLRPRPVIARTSLITCTKRVIFVDGPTTDEKNRTRLDLGLVVEAGELDVEVLLLGRRGRGLLRFGRRGRGQAADGHGHRRRGHHVRVLEPGALLEELDELRELDDVELAHVVAERLDLGRRLRRRAERADFSHRGSVAAPRAAERGAAARILADNASQQHRRGGEAS